MKSLLDDHKSYIILGASFISSALLFFSIPYDELNMSSQAFILKFSLSALFIGIFSVLLFKKTSSHSSILITLGYILSVLSRAIYDTTMSDESSHNLLLFEIVIMFLISFPSAFIGSYLANLLKKST